MQNDQKVHQRQRSGRFDAGYGAAHDARVVPSGDSKLDRLTGVEVDRLLLLGDGGRRFDDRSEEDRHPVGDAAEDAAVVVGGSFD